ncbi:MAG: hypothetical protein E6I86_00060 [Chloroflexi bacterium]|nr:MAG: hypothetical protein E6I86_00060 [Chloroflexota bacterium]
MRFVFNDPYTLRGAVHEMAGSQLATRQRAFENGIVRITIPRRRPRVAQTIKVQVAKGGETSPGVTGKPEVIEAVKGRGYREVAVKSNQRKGRRK